eukprot:CAMPEP_0196187944 /NCGR_PEP_ID=MMETSP0911-20130528/41312_1 /TAXON_ID=49265 /ORGANISM="Thalassiosira rotula, Strain GSO102" /LENGTH=34 /DNA_ID= /DNA_START= /DNA_END= /DNA_ORIENTATION=
MTSDTTVTGMIMWMSSKRMRDRRPWCEDEDWASG